MDETDKHEITRASLAASIVTNFIKFSIVVFFPVSHFRENKFVCMWLYIVYSKVWLPENLNSRWKDLV